MYPILFQSGGFTIDSYNVLWFIALSLAMFWTAKRFKLYGFDEAGEREARRVICWAFIAMLLGAGLYKPLLHIRKFASNPAKILTEGGLSEIGAVIGALLSTFLLCWNNHKISFQRLCDVGALPAFLSIAVGRWGCFLNGCCVGIISDFPLAVHFPRDAEGVLRHPTQLYYSACSVVFIVILIYVERALFRRFPLKQRDIDAHHAIVAPLALILYSVMRLSIDELRAITDPTPTFQLGRYFLIGSIPFGCVWLTRSIRKITA